MTESGGQGFCRIDLSPGYQGISSAGACAPCRVTVMGPDQLAFMLETALGKLLTSAVVKADWYPSLPPLGRCCGVGGYGMCSQGGLFRDI